MCLISALAVLAATQSAGPLPAVTQPSSAPVAPSPGDTEERAVSIAEKRVIDPVEAKVALYEN